MANIATFGDWFFTGLVLKNVESDEMRRLLLRFLSLRLVQRERGQLHRHRADDSATSFAREGYDESNGHYPVSLPKKRTTGRTEV